MPQFILLSVLLHYFTMPAMASHRAADLAFWQKIWDEWNMASATCTYGNLDGCNRNNPCVDCIDKFDGYYVIQCVNTPNGYAFSKIGIWDCNLEGTIPSEIQYLDRLSSISKN